MNYTVLFSAGIDSYILRFYAFSKMKQGDTLTFVYYDLKSRYSQFELDVINLYKDVIIDTTFNFADIEEADANIANRNFHLAMHAVEKYKADTVYIAGTKSDRVFDNTPAAMQDLSELLTKSLKRYVVVTSPFYDSFKEDIINWRLSFEDEENAKTVRRQILLNTFSCYNPLDTCEEVTCKVIDVNRKVSTLTYETHECRNCKACFRKNVSMMSIGYNIPFKNEKILTEYYRDFASDVMKTTRSNSTLLYAYSQIKEIKGQSKL